MPRKVKPKYVDQAKEQTTVLMVTVKTYGTPEQLEQSALGVTKSVAVAMHQQVTAITEDGRKMVFNQDGSLSLYERKDGTVYDKKDEYEECPA